ncbi:MAG: 4-(cytidine 5'-diphospho)-2-C-methyl-D-erythritol kinase [Cytophagales bacterium]|nr:4-(cytidine 5'-diphospho)-2-C-methyl-D-erythritol kinase [Cytophagales bacterium]
MIIFPNAKINLGLHVLRKRNDGFHDIETCMYPIPLKEALEIIPSKSFSFSHSGISIPGDSDNNLIVKAYQLLAEDFPELPTVAIHLHKSIPIGAGLGGGSADAAFTLSLLNQLFSLGLTTKQLENYASQLGSDCPFFIQNNPQMAEGRGEKLAPLHLDLSGNWLCLIHPGIHIGTKEAYGGIQPKLSGKNLRTILSDQSTWKYQLINDFEKGIFDSHPEIATIKEKLYEAGAWYAAMSGSGSAVFGLFKDCPTAMDLPENYFVFTEKLP